MKRLNTSELKEVIEVVFNENFEKLISRKFAENNYAKYLFIKYCRDKGMSYSIIGQHLQISHVAAGRYMKPKEYTPDVFVVELFEQRFYNELKKKIKAKT
jgi:hypothetical protein